MAGLAGAHSSCGADTKLHPRTDVGGVGLKCQFEGATGMLEPEPELPSAAAPRAEDGSTQLLPLADKFSQVKGVYFLEKATGAADASEEMGPVLSAATKQLELAAGKRAKGSAEAETKTGNNTAVIGAPNQHVGGLGGEPCVCCSGAHTTLDLRLCVRLICTEVPLEPAAT
eukprot:COSAG05_NODE_6409_length_963_cov_1.637731_1_plen_170_part_01